MVPFAAVLTMIATVQNEPTNQRMAPRALALEIGRVAESPLEAARMVVLAWRESRFVPDAEGDGHAALCAFQLQHAPKRVLRDLRLCTEIAVKRLRVSVAANPDHPFAVYASGRADWAWRLSDEREEAAQRLLL